MLSLSLNQKQFINLQIAEPVAEPEVVKSKPEDDGSTDIADIVDKWGAKD